MQAEQKARAYVARTEHTDGTGLSRARSAVAEWVAYWELVEDEWKDTDPDGVWEAAQARQLLEAFITPALDRLDPLPPKEQDRLVNLMVPFDSEDGLRDFILHFYQFAQKEGESPRFKQRDLFEREVRILHDLYKVKMTLEVIDIIRRAGRDPARRFPSRFSPDQQLSILNRLEEVLNLMFSQTLPEEHRQRIRDEISPAFLSAEQLLKRREAKLLYTYPHVLERYDYRRFYFLIYFKEGLKARFENEERTYRFNFLHFQWLKREFFVHWLETRLKGNTDKLKLYEQYQVHGRTLADWVAAEPERETDLLMEMPTEDFHAMAWEVEDKVAPDVRMGFEPETEKFGLYRRLKAQLMEAIALVTAPLETLRQIVADARGARPVEAPQAPAPEPEPPRPAAPTWQITRLDKGRVGLPFLTDGASGFNTALAAFKTKMGPDYADYAAYAKDLLEKTPETTQIRRRTPRHEWAMPFHVKRTLAGDVREYLLIFGGEAKAKPRGMGYQVRESYNVTPYLVFAAARPEEGFGEPAGERQALGAVYHEYGLGLPAVMKRCKEVLEAVRAKNKI